MNKKIIGLIMVTMFLFLLSGCNVQQKNVTSETTTDTGAYGGLYKENTVATINVEISDSDWQALLENATDEQYYSANVTINGETISNVGFRTKGFSSLTSVAQSDSDRYGFKIKFDKYVKNQTFNGLNMCVLNASFADPSYMREYLTYQALSYLGANTPKTTYTSLSVNGNLYGLYLCVESIDDSYVERTVSASATDTNLYKADSENCTLKENSDVTGFELKYGKDDKLSNISNLIETLNGMTDGNKGNIENILDVDSVLQSLAVNTVMGNYDSYSGSKAHNYYLLYSDGKFTYIPWDFNMSIGGFSEDNGASVTADVTQAIYNVSLDDRPLIKNLLAVDEYNQKYLAYVNKLISYFNDFQTQVNQVASLIRTYVENDPTAFYDTKTFEANIVASDTDLTTVTAGNMGGNKNMQTPDGTNGNAQTPDATGGNTQTPNGTGGNMQPPNGTGGNMQAPNSTGGNMQAPNSTGGNMQAPNSTGGNMQAPNGTGGNMQPPNSSYGNMQPPNSTNDNMQAPDGTYGNMQKPDGTDENKQMPNGGMISNNAVSIVDYITQRIEQIKVQLKL